MDSPREITLAPHSIKEFAKSPRPDPHVKRIPNRTLLLMILALAAFGRFWCATHRTIPAERPAPPARGPVEVTPVSPPPRSP